MTVGSMDGVGTMKACTRVVVPNNRIRMFSVHSWTKFRTESANRDMGILLDGIAVNQHEAAPPARLGEEVLREIHQMIQADGRRVELIRGRIVGPIDDERLADDILARHKTPVAA